MKNGRDCLGAGCRRSDETSCGKCSHLSTGTEMSVCLNSLCSLNVFQDIEKGLLGGKTDDILFLPFLKPLMCDLTG